MRSDTNDSRGSYMLQMLLLCFFIGDDDEFGEQERYLSHQNAGPYLVLIYTHITHIRSKHTHSSNVLQAAASHAAHIVYACYLAPGATKTTAFPATPSPERYDEFCMADER